MKFTRTTLQVRLASRETYTNTLSVVPSQASFFTQRFYDWEEVEKYTCQFIVWRNFVNISFRNDYKNDTSLRSRWNITWRSVSLRQGQYYWRFSLTWIMSFVRKHCLRLIRQGSSWTRFEYSEDSKISFTYFRIIEENALTNNKWVNVYGVRSVFFVIERILFTKNVVSISNPSWKTYFFHMEKKAKENERPSFVHHFTFLGGISMKRNSLMITHSLKKYTVTIIGNVIKISFLE